MYRKVIAVVMFFSIGASAEAFPRPLKWAWGKICNVGAKVIHPVQTIRNIRNNRGHVGHNHAHATNVSNNCAACEVAIVPIVVEKPIEQLKVSPETPVWVAPVPKNLPAFPSELKK